MIKQTYKGLTIELKEGGYSYRVYDTARITGEKVIALSGSSVKENTYNLEIIKESIDKYLTQLDSENKKPKYAYTLGDKTIYLREVEHLGYDVEFVG